MKPFPALLKHDPNTGAANLLAFAEWLVQANMSYTLIDLQFQQPPSSATLRWLVFILREELAGTIYQPGSTQLVVVDSPPGSAVTSAHIDRLQRLLERQAQRLNLVTLPVIRRYEIPAGSDPSSVLQHLTPNATDPGALLNQLIAQLAELGETLSNQEQFTLDPVTGLPNSFAARQQLIGMLHQAHKQGYMCSILLINGDHLRRYNELSFSAGDQMIHDLAMALREQLRPSDLLARWKTGDQFLIVLPHTGVRGAAALAERLRQRVIERSQLWPLPVTISIGVASVPQHGHDADEVLKLAASALAQAKANGKNRVIVSRVEQ